MLTSWAAAAPAAAETLEQYAAKCEAAIGAQIEDLDRDGSDFEAIRDQTPDATGHCEFPNRLNRAGDFEGRFRKQETSTTETVWLCRKERLSAGSDGDSAVIQYNEIAGATASSNRESRP